MRVVKWWIYWKEQSITSNEISTNIKGIEYWASENVWKQLLSEIEDEVYEAYQWAIKYGITTIDAIEYANPEWILLRWHLAKMVVNYVVNVQWKSMPIYIPDKCSRWDDDSEWESEEIKDYARKSCALGIMWINMEEFLPNQEVSRAEFGTVLSRLLWGNKYDVINTDEIIYYANHLYALKKASIMTQVDNPLERKELRWWVWVMLRRSRVRMEDEKLEDLK